MADLPVQLSYDSAVTLLRRAVMEKGADYVYGRAQDGDKCAYFAPEDGTPDCIIGHVLSYKRITMGMIGDLNEGMGVDNLIGPNRWITCDRRTKILLENAQLFQDRAEPWGESVDRALELAGRAVASA